ncbi:MAG: hypothetical protein LQ348_005731 [Seirophora lacunosa]|nr:MAG: hypothetical protein LQ348_005731 [Seirophora lacunosa]
MAGNKLTYPDRCKFRPYLDPSQVGGLNARSLNVCSTSLMLANGVDPRIDHVDLGKGFSTDTFVPGSGSRKGSLPRVNGFEAGMALEETKKTNEAMQR